MSIETQRPVYDTYQNFLHGLPETLPALSEEDGDYDTKPGDKGPDAYSSDTYVKRGAFALRVASSPVEIHDAVGEPVLRQDEQYVSIHLQELPVENANIGYIRESLADVADELSLPEYEGIQTVAGLTYARLGKTAMLFGFNQTELPVAADLAEDPAARPVVVHADKADFIERHVR